MQMPSVQVYKQRFTTVCPESCQKAVKKRALGRPATDEGTALRCPGCRWQTDEMQSYLQDSKGDRQEHRAFFFSYLHS